MAFHTLQVTLGAGATALTTAANRLTIRHALFAAAAHTYYIGQSNVDSTHGIPVATTQVPPTPIGPFNNLPVNTDEIFLSGTQNDVVQVAIID